MQTLEFTRALGEIAAGLKVHELIKILAPWLAMDSGTGVSEIDKNQFVSLILESHSGYDRLLKSEGTRKILSGLHLQELYEPTRMRRLLVGVSNSSNTQQIRGSATEFYSFFEALRSIARLEATSKDLLETEKVGEVPASDSLLALQVVDYDGQGIEPSRLIRVTEILTDLHMNLARMLDIHNDKLTFKYFDSGSDIIMAIQAAKAIIEALGPLLLQWWDKRRFQDHETYDKDMDALSKGLDLMTKTQETVTKGVLTDEEAKILKARVFQGIDDLIGLGATLPLRGNAEVDQRQLLIEKRDVKLLGSGQLADDTPPELPAA